MSRPRLAIASAVLALLALAAPRALAAELTVPIDQARTVQLGEPVAAVIVGNPMIADVTPHDERLFLITGKSFGATNLIALDADGREVYAADVHVVDGGEGRLVVHRGVSRESYSCFGECERIPMQSDNSELFDAMLESRLKSIDAANSQANANR